MNYLQPERLDELSARYVVGIMGRLARQRFEAIHRAHPAARLAVEAWQARLYPLLSDVEQVTPPKRVWRQIRRQLKRESMPRQTSPWRWATAAMAALAMALGLVLWQQQPSSDRSFAALVDAQGQMGWSLTIDRANELRVAAALPPGLSPEQRHELWVISGVDGVPVSLGLLPIAGDERRRLNKRQLRALASATTLAVSIEPLGGSPTGAPTGAVILTAPIVQTTTS